MAIRTPRRNATATWPPWGPATRITSRARNEVLQVRFDALTAEVPADLDAMARPWPRIMRRACVTLAFGLETAT